jgi:hypothetical protein
MLFYHFTAEEYLASILEHGLIKGELPINQRDVVNVVNLTSDKNPNGHGLTDGRALTEAEKLFLRQEGKHVSEDARFPNKRAIRITVKLPKSSVKQWLPWARKKLDHSWLDTMVEAGGGLRKARTWWFSLQPIPTKTFIKIERFDGAGSSVEVWNGAAQNSL